MPVYLDKQRNGYGRMIMCHMIADTPVELHALAYKIGMHRGWYQSPNKASFPHYDVSIRRRRLALANGALETTRREFVDHMRRVKSELIDAGKTWKTSGWWE